MVDYTRFIQQLGKSYQLHIESIGPSPEHLHRRYIEDFYKAMRLRCIRRVRPTYLRLVNIEDHSHLWTVQAIGMSPTSFRRPSHCWPKCAPLDPSTSTPRNSTPTK